MTGDGSIPTAGNRVNATAEGSHSPGGSPVDPSVDSSVGLPRDVGTQAARDIADVPAVEVITAAAVHLMSAAAVKCGLAEDVAADLDEARKLITALAALVTAAAPEIGNQHARPLRDGLRSLQLAFREASVVPDGPGQGPGEKWTGAVS
jgi:enoyl-CoA hydratase/carnithine racemase